MTFTKTLYFTNQRIIKKKIQHFAISVLKVDRKIVDKIFRSDEVKWDDADKLVTHACLLKKTHLKKNYVVDKGACKKKLLTEMDTPLRPCPPPY